MPRKNNSAQASEKKATEARKLAFDKAFAPVAVQIGRVARLWNQLHEELGLIFSRVLTPNNITIPLSAWHTQQNDRSQREMLRAAILAWHIHNKKNHPTLRDEIIWLLNEADILANKRNDALHMPINILMNCKSFEFSVEPNHFWGHPRALKLKGKDVLCEFSWYAAQIEALRYYASAAQINLASLTPLPKRPVLPPTSQFLNQKPTRRQTLPKRLRPPPRPSRA